jgi:hypothetical protein
MMTAPYLAVIIGLYLFENAWLSILLYHAQIGVWGLSHRGTRSPPLLKGWSAQGACCFVLPAVAAGPILYFLLPAMLKINIPLGEWLSDVGLRGPTLWLFAAYFGLCHPMLEEFHWSSIRQSLKSAMPAHFFFAFYHVLVVSLILQWPWALATGAVLFGSSWLWHVMESKYEGTLLPVLSHTLADSAIIVTVCLAARAGLT